MSVKKTSMLNPVKSLGYIKYYSSSSPRPLQALTILSDTTVRTSAVDWEDLKPYWKSEIRLGSSSWSTILLFPSFFKDFPNHRKETNWVRVFSRRPFPNSLKYRDQQWDLDEVQLPQSSSHFKEAVCFLPLKTFLANNFASLDEEDNTFGPLNRGGIADLPLLQTLLAIHRAQFMGSDGLFCFSSISTFGSFKNTFSIITNLS